MRRVLPAAVSAAAAVAVIAGCGGSGGGSTATTAAASELQAARQQGEEAAQERDRVDGLQQQVRSIKRRLRHRNAHPGSSAAASAAGGASTSVAPDQDGAGGPIRSFHAPSGNVSCVMFSDGATCTVESVGLSFILEGGSPARTEAAAILPSGLGELVEYGNTVSVGSITCEVPPSDVPRGITCIDQSDGHGFEASRVGSRQKAY